MRTDFIHHLQRNWPLALVVVGLAVAVTSTVLVVTYFLDPTK